MEGVGKMITYTTLEDVSYATLYDSFMKAFVGFRITKEADYKTFCEMLESHNYDASISVGAFDIETGELVSFVLNSILKNDKETAYDILTGTIPDYRRLGISSSIFVKVKELLKQKQVKLYTTEVLLNNPDALNLYLAQGFEIKGEVTNVIKIPNGSREVKEYKIVLKI